VLASVTVLMSTLARDSTIDAHDAATLATPAATVRPLL